MKQSTGPIQKPDGWRLNGILWVYDMTETVTYEGFLALVESMVRNRESGSLYLRTDTNRSVCIGIRQGEIEALVSGPRRGLTAIKTILGMSSGSCRRDETSLAFHTGDLPTTAEILKILRERRVESTAGSDSASMTDKDEAWQRPVDEERSVKILCDLLHDYLGPVAPLICDDLTQSGNLHTSADLDAAIINLAAEIESSSESQEFIQRARQAVALL